MKSHVELLKGAQMLYQLELNQSKVLGRGSSGTVYKCDKQFKLGTGAPTYAQYAIKKINISNISQRQLTCIHNEIRIMEILKQEHDKYIVDFIQAFKWGHHMYIVMEYCQTNLYDYIYSKLLHKQHIVVLFRQILIACKHMLSHNIAHRDLKPENILIKFQANGTPSIRVADFGFSKQVKSTHQMLKSTVGTPLYCSPQILKGGSNKNTNYSTKSDIWSLGIIYYQMITGTNPWEHQLDPNSNDDLAQLAQKHKTIQLILEQNLRCHQDKSLLKRMLVVDENQRIKWEDLFSKFFIGKTNKTDTCLKQNTSTQNNIPIDRNKKNVVIELNKQRQRILLDREYYRNIRK